MTGDENNLQRTLGRVEANTVYILSRLDKQDERMNLHSRRLGSLERWRHWVLGATAVIGVLLGWVASKIGLLPPSSS